MHHQIPLPPIPTHLPGPQLLSTCFSINTSHSTPCRPANPDLDVHSPGGRLLSQLGLRHPFHERSTQQSSLAHAWLPPQLARDIWGHLLSTGDIISMQPFPSSMPPLPRSMHPLLSSMQPFPNSMQPFPNSMHIITRLNVTFKGNCGAAKVRLGRVIAATALASHP